MFGVKNQWNMDLSIGGKSFPSNTTTVRTCLWFENIHQNLPSLSLELVDESGDFSTIASAGDGVPIDITLGDGGKSGETSANFVILGAPQISRGQGTNLIKINAVLDHVNYLRSIVSGLYEGTSGAVLQKIAGSVGLTYKGDSSSDAQVWLPNNKTLSSFVRSVAMHGWAGAGSCFIPAVTSARELVYRNIMQPTSEGEIFGYEDGHVIILDWDATSNAMVTNNNGGYGSTSVGFDPTGTLTELNKITFNLFSSVLGVSSKNIEAIGQLGGRIDGIIRSAGNTHENYEQAKHQNARIRSTFSADMNMLIADVSRTTLLSQLTAIPLDYSRRQPNQSLSGPYILTSRTRCLTRSKYAERLVATSQGASL